MLTAARPDSRNSGVSTLKSLLSRQYIYQGYFCNRPQFSTLARGIFSLIKNREAEKSEPVGRICGTPSAPGHEVQPVCFDTSELSFVLIVYQICFRPWHRSVTRFDSVTRSFLCVSNAWPSRARPTRGFVCSAKFRRIIHQRCLPRSCDSAAAKLFVRNFVDAIPRVIYVCVYIYAASALFGDPSPKRLSDKMHRLSFRPLPRG